MPKTSNALDLAIAKHQAVRADTDAAKRQGARDDEIARMFAKEWRLLETISAAPCTDDAQFFQKADYTSSVACNATINSTPKRIMATIFCSNSCCSII